MPPTGEDLVAAMCVCIMDYSKFRFRAVVDWLEIEITTSWATNFPFIRRVAELSYVVPLDGGSGGSATRFRFRIYDPARWADVEQIVARINDAIPLASPASVTAVEVAFDAYCQDATVDDLAAQVQRFYRETTVPAQSKNRRLYWDFKGSVKAIPQSQESLTRHLIDGYQIGIGDREADVYQHLYVKTTDHNGQPIPDRKQHRARAEVTLRGNALRCKTMDDLRLFRFESLSNYFRFRCEPAANNPLNRMIVDAISQIGEKKTRSRAEGGTRLHARGTRASPLNEMARSCLRELSRRWERNQQTTNSQPN